MPHFYFHLCNGSGFVEDDSGQDCPTVNDARIAAVAKLRRALADDVHAGNINVAAFIEIENENRAHIETIHFADAVSVTTENSRKAR
ncbi:MAG TPA: hypothetical protein VGE65_03585 [Sphingobium sp.]